MPAEGDFTRRICAIMLADVSGYSTLVGADDERTARAVRQLQEVACGIVADANGQAEARAGDAIFATFDSVVAAVTAALAILTRVATEEFTGQRLPVRIGLHFGDVLLREGGSLGDAVGDAINITARLEALARPGTICVSEGVYQHVRNKIDATFIDLGRQKLKNIANPIHAYLIIPKGGAAVPVPRPSRWRWVAWGAAVVAVVLMVATVVLQRRSHAPGQGPPARRGGSAAPFIGLSDTPAAEEPVTLGVMLFKGRGGGGADDWRCEALRDGLNAQLSRLPRVKVYSKEFIDFLINRKGLSEIEAATQLGIQKMLSGSFVATQQAMQIEIHVVDVETGVLESSYTASGTQANFLELQNELTLGVLARLELPVSDEEKQMLLAQQNTDAEALKLLMQVEGGLPAAAAPTPARTEPRSQLDNTTGWLFASPALADTAESPEVAIRDVLEHYRRAMEAGDVDEIASLYTEFSPDLQAVQRRYFDGVRDLHVAIDNLDVAVVGEEAVVSYTRTDDFTDVRTGRPMHVAVRVTKVLRQADGTWKLSVK